MGAELSQLALSRVALPTDLVSDRDPADRHGRPSHLLPLPMGAPVGPDDLDHCESDENDQDRHPPEALVITTNVLRNTEIHTSSSFF